MNCISEICVIIVRVKKRKIEILNKNWHNLLKMLTCDIADLNTGN